LISQPTSPALEPPRKASTPKKTPNSVVTNPINWRAAVSNVSSELRFDIGEVGYQFNRLPCSGRVPVSTSYSLMLGLLSLQLEDFWQKLQVTRYSSVCGSASRNMTSFGRWIGGNPVRLCRRNSGSGSADIWQE